MFTNQQILDITRRQLQITLENNAYAATATNVTAQQTTYLNVDNANAVIYGSYETTVNSYEAEIKQINGVVPGGMYSDGTISPYTAGDLSTSAYTPGATSATFFPPASTYPPDGYTFLNPYIGANSNAVNGINYPGTSILLNEQLILPYINSGMTGTGESTTVVTGPNLANPNAFDVADITNFTALPENVFITDGTNSGLYQVLTAVPVNGIIPAYIAVNIIIAPVTKPGVGATVDDTVPNTNHAFVMMLVLSWQTLLMAEQTALTAQNDTRATQMTQNATALANINTALSAITTWLGSPTYPPASLQAIITTRTPYLTTRITQIMTALGGVHDNGDGTYSDTGTNSAYYNRYKWIDHRINKASGSARQYFGAGIGISTLTTLQSNNTAVQGDYDAIFLTKRVIFNDASNIIHVADVTSISTSDTITIVSDSAVQPGTFPTFTVLAILGTTQLKLSAAVPNTYLTADMARIYKTL